MTFEEWTDSPALPDRYFDIRNSDVAFTDLSVRALSCLEDLGIHNLQELNRWSKRDLLNTRNLGLKTLAEFREIGYIH